MQSKDSLESQKHINYVLEQGAEKSNSPDTDTIKGLLKEKGMKDPSEHISERVSWSGPKNGMEGGVASLACSKEWEGRKLTSYEVTVKLLTAKDEKNHNIYT